MSLSIVIALFCSSIMLFSLFFIAKVHCSESRVNVGDGNGMIVEAKNETAGITHDRSADCRPILAIRRFTTD